jgi:nucleoside-diphosphate-sugar epimerase
MKCLVTGASGYVGCHLVQRLTDKGIATRAFVRQTSNIEKIKSLKNLEIVYGDLREPSSVVQALRGVDIVFHTGALVSDWGDYQRFYAVNCLGTKNVLEASLKAGIQKLIYLSTIDVLDLKGREVVDEDLPYDLRAKEYSRSKIEAEKIVRKYMNRIPTVILRPPAVYGPRDPQCTTRALKMAKKNLLFMISRGKGTFPHIYIDNLIEGLLLAAQKKEAAGGIFNVSDGRDTTAGEFFDHLNKIAGKGPIRLFLPYPLAWVLALFMEAFARLIGKPPLLSWTALRFLSLKCRFDISKARRVLGYRPFVSLEEGMQQVRCWWESRGVAEKIE